MLMEIASDDIAETVQRQFDALPQKRKPQARGDGQQEWVSLSGIVAQGRNGLKCVALGTGMKCLPHSKLDQAKGVVLHDWHAEVVAIRSFNHFLLKECQALLLSQEQGSDYIRRRSQSEMADSHFQPFTLHGDISLHMYCSEAPCGDASMELTMAAQDDPTPWAVPFLGTQSSSPSLSPAITLPLQGRGHFSQLGLVRRKPSRPDAPPTLSKSCSDKLSLKQTTSLLSGPSSLLISPENAYLSSLTLPESQYSPTACERAFSEAGRMAPLKCREWPGGYSFHPFSIKTTGKEFHFSRRRRRHHSYGPATPLEGDDPSPRLVPSNLAAAWTPYLEETLIGGVLQGRRQFDHRGASLLCRGSQWKLAVEVASLVPTPAVGQVLSLGSYKLVKVSGLLEGRKSVKDETIETALKAWTRNEGDEVWGIR